MTRIACTRASGVTLVELMVSLLVTSVVLSGVVVTVNSQQQSYYSGHRSRAAQMSARAAQLFIEQRLRDAGLDMDPSLALDFSYYGRSGGPLNAGPCPTAMTPCDRDRSDNSDELVFYSRNKHYRTFDPTTGTLLSPPVGKAWTLGNLRTDSTIEINAKANDRFLAGQILQAVCPDGNTFAYFTVGQSTVEATAPGTVQLQLLPVIEDNPFRRQDIIRADANGCFPHALVFQIDRYRFHVTFPVQLGTGRDLTQPFLALDRGLDTDGNDEINELDEQLIAEGVELLQVAYVFMNPALPDGVGTGPTIVPTKFGPAFGVAPTEGRTDYFPSSFFQYSTGHSQRQNNNQANIAAVKVAMLVRSPTADLTTHTNIRIDGSFSLLNLNGPVAWIASNPNAGTPFEDGYQRTVIQSTIPLNNATLRGTALF